MATEYKVFRLRDGAYVPAGVAEAHSPAAAAKAVDQASGSSYLCVPTSSAHFVDLAVEQPPARVVAKVSEGPTFPMLGQTTIVDDAAQTGIPVE